MAGTVRKRIWTTGKGETKSAWQVSYTDREGKRRTDTFGKKRDADAALLKIQTEVRNGTHTPDATSVTLADAAQLWLEHCEGAGLGRGPLRVYGQYVRLCILPLLGNQKLSRLTAGDVEDFRDKLVKRMKRGRARAVLSALKSILANAQRKTKLAQNVGLAVKIGR